MAGKWKGLAIPKSTGMEEWQEKFLAQQKEFAEKQEEKAKEEGKERQELQNTLNVISDKNQQLNELQETSNEREDQIARLLQLGGMTQKQAKYLRIRNKLTLTYHKWLIKNKLFQTISVGLKKMASGAGSFLMTLIKFLLVATLFPGLLPMLINMFIKIVLAIIKAITPFIPKMVLMFIKIMTETIPDALKKIVSALFPALSTMFGTWAGQLEASHPLLAKILRGLQSVFGADGFLTKFVLKAIPFIIGLGIASKLMGFTNVMKILGGTIKTLTVGIWKFGKNLLSGYYKRLIQWRVAQVKFWLWQKGMWIKEHIFKKAMIYKEIALTKLQSIGQAIYTAIRMIDPIFLIIAGIVLAIALVVKFRKQIWHFFKWVWKIMKKIGKWIWKFIQPVVNIVKKIASVIWKVLKPLFKFLGKILAPIIRVMKPVFAGIGKVMAFIWDLLKNTILRAFKGIQNAFRGILNFFTGVSTFGAIDWIRLDKIEKDRFLAYQKLAQKKDADVDIIEDAVKMDQKEYFAKYGQAGAKLYKQVSKYDDYEEYATDVAKGRISVASQKIHLSYAKSIEKSVKKRGIKQKNR